MTEPAVAPEPADSPSEGPSPLVREVREKYPEPPRAGSLKKLAPGQGLALLGLLCCAWTPFILWWVFGPAALVLGFLAYRKGVKLAKWLMVAAVVCMVRRPRDQHLPDTFVSN